MIRISKTGILNNKQRATSNEQRVKTHHSSLITHHSLLIAWSSAGFTLLEVMIALAITAGVVITALTSLNYHLILIEDNKNIIIATILGMEKMEEIGLYRSAEKLVPESFNQGKEGDFGEGFPQFSYRINIEDTEFKGLKQIYLKVSWKKDREVSYVTYKLVPEGFNQGLER